MGDRVSAVDRFGLGMVGLMLTVLVGGGIYTAAVVGAGRADAKRTARDESIDAAVGTLNSATIARAMRVGGETHLLLTDGRLIVVRGYKGHHFYERKAGQ